MAFRWIQNNSLISEKYFTNNFNVDNIQWLPTSTIKVVLWALFLHSIFLVSFALGNVIYTNTWHGMMLQHNLANPQMVRLHLKKSKCDQFCQGFGIILGCTGSLPIVPCSSTAGLHTLVDKRPGPLCFSTWTLTHSSSQKCAKSLTQLDCFQRQYAGHSFHIADATTASLAEIEDSNLSSNN